MHAIIDQLREALDGEFEIVRPLGEGSVAEVFLARETALDRPVAIKVMRARLALDETARRRFLREARLSARIHHPNVGAVYRVGELPADGRPYLVMEYIDGRTFEDVLAATGPLAEAEARQVLAEVAAALDAAHRLDIIHRDIRPGNIMRARESDRVVLADFGLAGVHETGESSAGTRLTSPGQVLGDVRYTPPEQLMGEPAEPGSDLYALAVTAYELLTGHGPFPDARGDVALIRAHLSGTPAPLRQYRPDAGGDLEDVLLRCLQKKPGQRPTARQLLQRLGGGEAPEPAPEGTVQHFMAELKRRRVYKVGAAYGAFLLVVLAIVDGALPALPFVPDWLDTVLVTGVLVGLPASLVLAWVYDLTDGGVRRTPSTDPHPPVGIRALQVGALVLALLAAALVAWLVLR